jgi:ferritin-like metal-binding protein YciE
MKKIYDLNDLMAEQLRDMFDSEIQLTKEISKLQSAASNTNLKEIIVDYIENNEEQVFRLKQAFDILYQQKRGEKCEAMEAMLKEAKDLMIRSMDAKVMDAGIITALQHIIHYQIAGYGAISNYANMLSLYDIAALMHQNLEGEKKIDRKLAQLAEEEVNLKAKKVS